jgi:hypothetical protein
MNKIYFTIIVAILTLSCKDGVKQSEYDKLKAELNECKTTVEELRNTPQIRLSNGQQFLSKYEIINAKKEFNELIEKFGETEEAKIAMSLIAGIEKEEKERKEEEERKKNLGFKALTETSTVSAGNVTLKFNSVSTGGNFAFDRYDNRWSYRDAERGEVYVLANISVTSKIKEPELPPMSVYKNENGSLSLIGTLEYKFYRWEDYSSYLGNDADYGNDFAHTATIKFSCGLSISKEDIENNVVFVVVKKENCFLRSTERFANPPVSYISSGCNMKSTLKVEDFDKDYVLVKIFNKNKL